MKIELTAEEVGFIVMEALAKQPLYAIGNFNLEWNIAAATGQPAILVGAVVTPKTVKCQYCRYYEAVGACSMCGAGLCSTCGPHCYAACVQPVGDPFQRCDCDRCMAPVDEPTPAAQPAQKQGEDR